MRRASSALAVALVLSVGAILANGTGEPGGFTRGPGGGTADEQAEEPRGALTGVDGTISPSRSEEVSNLALDRGLAFLATRLDSDGSLLCAAGPDHAPVGVTALGALAFMAAGNTPGRGPHGDEVERMVQYLLTRVTPRGERFEGYISDERDPRSEMHGHGLATLVLAQAYSMSPASPRGRRTQVALEAAVRRIEESQSLEGGWYYKPRAGNDHEGSITVCVVQALRAAKETGIHVDLEVVGRAIEYVKRLQAEDGGFQYALSQPETSVALTAACLSTLHATGIYTGTEVDSGYDYIWRELGLRAVALERNAIGQSPRFPYYERFYLSQALWQHPDEGEFERWYEVERERVLVDQLDNGSWPDLRHNERGVPVRDRYGSSYSTAMNCLFLALPGGVLPILQR